MKSKISIYKKEIFLYHRYDHFLNNEIAKRLIDHLEYIKIKPRIIIGFFISHNTEKNIKSLYKNVYLINIFRKNKYIFLKKKNKKILLDDSADISLLDFSFNWHDDFSFIVNNIYRVSKNKSIFLFSNIKSIKINNYFIYNVLSDNYKMTDLLSKNGYSNVVLDSHKLNIKYISYKRFFSDFLSAGIFTLGDIFLQKISLPISIEIDLNFGYANILK